MFRAVNGALLAGLMGVVFLGPGCFLTHSTSNETKDDVSESDAGPGGEENGVGDASGESYSCGNGVAEGDEQCDGEDMNGATCVSLGEGEGTLLCDPETCTFDISMCTTCCYDAGGYGSGVAGSWVNASQAGVGGVEAGAGGAGGSGDGGVVCDPPCNAGVGCSPNGQCVPFTEGPSCNGAGLGCNDNGTAVSCCDAKLVSGGTFPMGRCGSTGADCSDAYAIYADEVPEHNATVTDFYLDTFEVTVGRFRKFVEAYDGTPPAAGAGAQPFIADSGWQSSWNTSLPADQATLISDVKCWAKYQTWTDTVGANEQYPVNCVSWYDAFAFCIWDNGRLPTEVEWEYAAAGGDANRLYPWGSEAPDRTQKRANMGWEADSPYIDVGSYPDGIARWSQHDLAGSMNEWVLDWYDEDWYQGDGNTCNNCANLNSASYRVKRGGSWIDDAGNIRSALRGIGAPTARTMSGGFRCARTP